MKRQDETTEGFQKNYEKQLLKKGRRILDKHKN